ncbi:MAG: hypothetical protein WCE61_07135 [Candidatus Acidiferrum sp.]
MTGKNKLVTGFAALALVLAVGWQIGSAEISNLEFEIDLRDVAAQPASRIGLDALRSDDEIRDVVIQKAASDGVQLAPEQISLQHTGTGDTAAIYLAADYTAPVNLLLFSFNLHFTPSSKR